jgi:large subunit ribosomal protein L22
MTGPKTNEGATKVGERTGTRAKVRYVRSSAYKAREVLNLIRGTDVHTADETLQLVERDIAIVIRKALASAVANAVNNDNQSAEELYISACFADEGPTLKRFRPRARGRAFRIRKRTCHITVIVSRMPDRELEQRRKNEASKPTARGRRGAAATASGRRERVARSRATLASRRGTTGHDHDHDHDAETTAEAEPIEETETSAEAEPIEASVTDDTSVEVEPAEGSASDEAQPIEASGSGAGAEGSASDEAQPTEENRRADEGGTA